MVEVDAVTLTALATWAVAIGTIVVLWWQTHVARKLNGANAVMDLRERFDAPRMRRARKLLAQRLITGRHEDISSMEVAAFFELVGALTHQRVLDREIVWEAFGTWISGYHHALRNPVDLIGRARTEFQDPLIMHEFEWLTGAIAPLDRQHQGIALEAPTDLARTSMVLLRQESELDLD